MKSVRNPKDRNPYQGRSTSIQREGSYVFGIENKIVALLQDEIYMAEYDTGKLTIIDVEGPLLLLQDYPNPTFRAWILPAVLGGVLTKLDETQTLSYLADHAKELNGLRIQGGAVFDQFGPRNEAAAKLAWNKVVGTDFVDKDHNHYDYYTGADAVGSLIVDYSSLNFEDALQRSIFNIDYEGNLYVQSEGVVYYRGRDWGYIDKPETMTIGDTDLYLHPGKTELLLSKIPKGTHATLLERTKQVQTDGGTTAPWFKIRLLSGKVGWVFGGVLQSQEGQVQIFDSPVLSQTSP